MHPEDVMKRYETNINLHRFDELLPLIAEDAVFWFSDGSHEGIDAARRAFEDTWRKIEDEAYWLEDLVWIAKGDRAASCIYRFRWTGIWAGEPASGEGRGTTVLRKEGERWRIVHEHLSRPSA